MTNLVIVLLGFIFGILLSYAGLNKYNTIAGLSVLKNFTVAKTIMLVLGVGGILLTFELMSGDAVFHIKPLYVLGTALGGIIFGIGMSVLGYCPGTLPISVGQGSLDAIIGVIGGLCGGILYSVFYPSLIPMLGHEIGDVSLFTLMGGEFSWYYILVVIVFSAILIIGAFLLDRIDMKNNITSRKWIITGVGLALLNLVLFYKNWQNQPMGASSSYPYIGDQLVGLTGSTYFTQVMKAGNWEAWFLFGAFFAGLVQALVTKTFRFRLMQELWIEYKGNTPVKRFVWAFLGGILLIFGARMAGGCTSGHIISGGMQIAISSYVFAIFTFIGFLGAGYLFYTLPRKR